MATQQIRGLRRNAKEGGQGRRTRDQDFKLGEPKDYLIKSLMWNVKGISKGHKTAVICKWIKDKSLDFFRFC